MKTKYLIYTALFAALTCISAFFKIPVPGFPFPITLQVLFVILAGLILPPKYALASQALYVVIGLIGIPVFSMGGGFGYVLQPSFGILLGFIAAAFVIALIKKYVPIKRKFWLYLLASCIGIIVIYLIGTPYMYMILNFVLSKGLAFKYVAISYGLVFMPFDFIKACIASYISFEVLKRVKI